MKKNDSRGELLLVFGVLSFTFEWYFVRQIGNLGFTSLDAVFGRLFYSLAFFSLAYAAWKLFSKKPAESAPAPLTGREKLIIGLMGADAVATNFLFNYSVQKTSVANALVLFYTSVFWGAFLGYLFYREKISRRQLACTLAAFVGIIIALVDYSKVSISFGAGEMAALSASITFSFEIVMARGLKNADFPKRMIGMYLAGSAVALIAIVGSSGSGHVASLFSSPAFIGYAVVFALTCGVLGKGLSYLGINSVPVSKALLILLLEPLAQMISAYFIAGESVNLVNAAGICIVFAAVYLSSKAAGPQPVEA